LASLDLTVLTSTSESLSNAILESMAAGVPVVAYRIGGNAELISDDRGILVCDEEEIAQAIARLLHDPGLRRELGRHGQEFAAEQFSIDRIRSTYEQLYNDLWEKKRGIPAKYRPVSSPALIQHRRRVAVIAPTLRYIGGQSAQAHLLLREWLHDPEIETRFIAIDPNFPRGLRWVQRIPGLRTLLRAPIYLFHVWRNLKGVEIAHIFSASYWSFLIAPAPAWFLARLLSKRTVIHYHSGEAPDHLRRFRSARYVLKRVDRLVVPSEYLKEVFRKFDIRAEVIPNVVELSRFPFRLRNPLRPHLVCTRGFHPYYCVDIVVQAFAEVKRFYPDACLDLVGDGATKTEIAGLVRHLNLTGVRFLGIATREEIPDLYNQADVFINASRLDNMPVSILEAFASGTPVVTTAPDGIRYIVEHERTGLLSDPGDPRALAHNVMRLLREPDLGSKLATTAYAKLRLYKWERVRDQWLGYTAQ
jgi:glycosyltransferase involved in cell wall biosynthesis